MRWSALWLVVGLSCGGGPEKKPGPVEHDCFHFERGDACTLEWCCDDNNDCWYQASDQTTWPCANKGFCAESESTVPRAHCGAEKATTDPQFEVPCRWEGTWAIDTAWCGMFEAIEIQDAYPDTRVVFSTPDKGGCEVDILWEHVSGCSALEEWSITGDDVLSFAEMDVERHGLSGCDPALCLLGDTYNHVVCVEGARVGKRTTHIEEDAYGNPSISGPWSEDVLPFCVNELEVVLMPPKKTTP